MRTKHGWARKVRNTVAALGLVAGSAATAGAASMLTYDTVGSSVDNSTGVSGTPVIKFVPVTGGSFLAPSNLSFGTFQVTPQADGMATTYTNTPFTIKFTADALNGETVNPNETPLTIHGVLNGTASGADSSSVVATFTDPAPYVFKTGLYTNTMSLPDSPLRVTPSTSGSTTAQAFLSNSSITAPVPEPSTIALFAVTLAGLGVRQRGVIRRRNAATA